MTQFYSNNTSKNPSLLFNKDASTYFSNPNRVPFTDITQQMNSHNNNNQKNQKIFLENIFNDFSNNENKFMFLKKKSHGEDLNYYEEYDLLNNNEILFDSFKSNFKCFKSEFSKEEGIILLVIVFDDLFFFFSIFL